MDQITRRLGIPPGEATVDLSSGWLKFVWKNPDRNLCLAWFRPKQYLSNEFESVWN